jgi:hypothetical protein
MIINENGHGNAPVVEEVAVKKTKKQVEAEASAEEVVEDAEQE